MKKIFPNVFEVKVTIVSFVLLFVVSFLACAGINFLIQSIHLPSVIEIILLVLCTLYFCILVFIAFLNLLGIVKVKEN